MRTISDICYGKSGHTAQKLDIYLPDCDRFPVFLYFHGGALEVGDKSEQQVLFRHLTDHGIAAVSANYRMYPEAKYPDFLLDAAEAAAWVFRNIGTYGNVDGIFIGGSSAGGYLSQMLCFDKRWLAAHGISPMEVSGFVHDAGQPTCHFNVLRERGIDTRRLMVDDTAALYHVGTAEIYPPMLIIVSDNDMPSRYEQTMLLMSTLSNFGHKAQLHVAHGEHCAYVDAVDEKGVSVFGRMVSDFIRSSL